MKVLHTKNGKLRISGEFTHDDLFRVASELAADYLPDMPLLTSPNMVKNFLTAKLRHRSREGFEVLYCNNQNRMIAAETLFEGTIDGGAVDTKLLIGLALLVEEQDLLEELAHTALDERRGRRDLR